MEEMYRQNAKIVYGFLFSKCRDPVLAEDLTQETFLRAILNINSYDGTCKLSVWLCQIAKHMLYQYWQKHKKTVSLNEGDWELVSDLDLERLVMAHCELEEVKKEIRRLPENMRMVVFFRASLEMPFREIGEIMGKTENWARVTFYRAKEILKEKRRDSYDKS